MFISKTRDIVIPQIEHARLSGAIAHAWGNEEFQRPKLPFQDFVAAVTLHDRGYGIDDSDGIGEMSSERWLELQRSSAQEQSDNKIIELIILFQLRRISTYSKSTEKDLFISELNTRIDQLLTSQPYSREDYLFADRITQLSDNISFDFCHEEPTPGRVEVLQNCAYDHTVDVEYHIEKDGLIYLSPWPLAVSELKGYIIGYKRGDYPRKKSAIAVEYSIRRK